MWREQQKSVTISKSYVPGPQASHSLAFGAQQQPALLRLPSYLHASSVHASALASLAFPRVSNRLIMPLLRGAGSFPTPHRCRTCTVLSFAPFLVTALFSSHSASAYNTMSTDKINNVIISIAMEDEAKPFVEHLSLKADADFFPPQAPFHAFSGAYKDCQVTVITGGKDEVHGAGVDNVGTVPAAVSTFLALQKLDGQADLLINAGTCGGFKAMGAEIGDVFLTTGVANHDRRIPIPAFEPYGVGFIESVSVPKLKEAIDAKEGVCTTGNSLDKHDIDDFHMKKNNASVKDMEAAAIGWACELHKMPHFGVKVVTDIVDGDKPTQEEFFENLHKAADSLQATLPKVIEHVCGRDHDEL